MKDREHGQHEKMTQGIPRNLYPTEWENEWLFLPVVILCDILRQSFHFLLGQVVKWRRNRPQSRRPSRSRRGRGVDVSSGGNAVIPICKLIHLVSSGSDDACIDCEYYRVLSRRGLRLLRRRPLKFQSPHNIPFFRIRVLSRRDRPTTLGSVAMLLILCVAFRMAALWCIFS